MNIITKIECGNRNKNRVNIYIDEEYAFSVDMEIVYKEGLKVKDSVDYDKLKKIIEEDNYIKCKNAAIKIIERSYKSEKEIKDKLLKKEFDNNTVNRTLSFLKEYNLIDDEKLVSMYVKDRLRNQGEKKIKYSLMQKGINEELIYRELNKVNNDDLEDIAYNLALKKYEVLSKRENDKYKLYQKLTRYLMSRGYGYDLISRVVKRIVN
mgnify:FL=1